jgi:hypothetical protein
MAEMEATAKVVPKVHRFASVAATLLDASKTLGTWDVSSLETVYIRLTVAVAALTAFAIQMRANADDAFLAIADAAADFTTPVHPIINKGAADLVTAGVGSHWVWVDVRGIQSIRIVANSGGTATLALELGGN